jgi:predicted TIM-barrel fold metal-dependent hydrolase
MNRRDFLTAAGAVACSAAIPKFEAAAADPIVDIHQHTNYHGRMDDGLVQHQRALGAVKTVLLPGGSRFGLEGGIYGNESVMALAKQYPNEFVFFANEDPSLPEAVPTIEKYLKLGAIGIGEQKFFVDCDSPHIVKISELARSYDAPILLHFQKGKFNEHFDRFHTILEKFSRVNYIAHAQTTWGNIDRDHDQYLLYPKGKVTPGGLTDRWLADYPNFYADLSAGSGANALARDEDHAREFLERHQDKLMWGSDCEDVDTKSARCVGLRQLTALRRLAADRAALEKILFRNASRVMKIKL